MPLTDTQLNATQPTGVDESRLANLPVPIFAIVMGMAGTAIVYLKAGQILWHNQVPGIILTAVTTGLFAVLAVAYGLKALHYPHKVREEFDSPVKLHFFPTLSISLLLLSVAFLHLQSTVSFWLWAIGATAHLYFMLKTLGIWIHKEHFVINHIEPSWFIPVVGNLLVPIAGVEHAPADISWFFFSIGLLFWVMLFTIFLYRIIFHQPLPTKRIPTFFMLIAPPAVAFISYTRMIGGIDSFARIMYFFALFLFLLLVSQWRMFRSMQFFISWWAYSFPIAALTVATIAMSTYDSAALITWLAWTFLGLLTVVVSILLALTIRAALRHEICTPEG